MRLCRLLVVLCLLIGPLQAYSVLSHEAIVDALWNVRIRSLLLSQYPDATPDELRIAHGYCYGGSIIQDLGYYPNSNAEFSDLTHYVRTGSFILALLQDSKNLNELSFALGALSHYLGDLDGHRYATNVAEPVLYPKLLKKFGPFVTFEDAPPYHLKTEFGFDVLEVARGNFAPQSYHDFIGFYVSNDLIARAFHDTYGLGLSDLFPDFALAIDSYRSVISRLIPQATRVAWAQNQEEIQRANPAMERRRFVYTLKRSSYEREWGKRYAEPSAWDKFLAFLLRLLPPIGPLRTLHFKVPTAQVEQLFIDSFARASSQYRGKLDEFGLHNLVLPDANYDVGTVTNAGEYQLADQTQAYWLHKLADKQFATLTPTIKQELTGFFKDLSAPMKLDPLTWKQLRTDYAALQTAQPVENN